MRTTVSSGKQKQIYFRIADVASFKNERTGQFREAR